MRGLLHSTFDSGSGLQQVRPTEIAHEHEVATEDADRFGCPTASILHEETHVLRCMSGRVHRRELDSTDPEGFTIGQFGVGIRFEPA